jgi:hypothetical protein
VAHGNVGDLHSNFFGLPHMFAVVKLLGSRSLPWLVRALLDFLSQKVWCHVYTILIVCTCGELYCIIYCTSVGDKRMAYVYSKSPLLLFLSVLEMVISLFKKHSL